MRYYKIHNNSEQLLRIVGGTPLFKQIILLIFGAYILISLSLGWVEKFNPLVFKQDFPFLMIGFISIYYGFGWLVERKVIELNFNLRRFSISRYMVNLPGVKSALFLLIFSIWLMEVALKSPIRPFDLIIPGVGCLAFVWYFLKPFMSILKRDVFEVPLSAEVTFFLKQTRENVKVSIGTGAILANMDRLFKFDVVWHLAMDSPYGEDLLFEAYSKKTAIDLATDIVEKANIALIVVNESGITTFDKTTIRGLPAYLGLNIFDNMLTNFHK